MANYFEDEINYKKNIGRSSAKWLLKLKIGIIKVFDYKSNYIDKYGKT